MFSTYHWVLLLSLFMLNCSSARLLHLRHNHKHHGNDFHHDHDRRNNHSEQFIVQRTIHMKSTGEPVKLTLVNAYPSNGFYNAHFNRRWNTNANENEQQDVEINWNRDPTAAVTSTTFLSTTTMRSLRDRSYNKHHVG